MARSELMIDLDALVANWRALAAASGNAEAGAVVKADAYGLGAAMVAARLAREGAKKFFVAIAEEGIEVRHAVGPDPQIFVFGGHMAGDATVIRNADLIPMLNSAEQWQRHQTESAGRPFGIQLDSGMNRLGMEPAEWNSVKDAVLAANPVLVMSHLACADEPDHAMNAQQLAAFKAMTDGINAPRALSATGGILLGSDYHFDVTRPGIGMYGAEPFVDAQPVAHLNIPVIQSRIVEAGETVGYGNSWTAEKPTRVATIAAGYADGIIRAQSGKGKVYANGVACPILGRVSMDLIGIDITHLDHVPETVELLGKHQTVDQVATAAGTIGYEILTSLGNRYQRKYIGA
jgi:alanine racemase